MGYRYYASLVLVPNEHPLTFEKLASNIQAKFSGHLKAVVEVKKPEILIRVGEWSLRLTWEDQDHIAVESAEIASITKHPDQEIVVQCSRRISTGGDDDPDMKHINDHIFVVEVFDAIPGLYYYDPMNGDFFKSPGIYGS